MNPQYLLLIQQLAATSLTLFAQAKGKDMSGLISIAPMIQAVTTAYNNSMSVLGRAQAEGWKDDDIRWAEPFGAIDATLEALAQRMT